jgi:broad specificity phosphatase PhoE
MHWAEILSEVPLDAIYTTDFERTSMTAAPTAVKQDITVQYYSPDDINITQFKTDNLGKNVLMVGHSNTTPDFVNKMIGQEKYGALDDYDNGSLFIVQVIGENVTDTHLNFNCNCPE